MRTFYREAGPQDAPVVLLPHGYPSSSFQFRNLMPALADRWRLVAPDYPDFGYSATPADFAYTSSRTVTSTRTSSGPSTSRCGPT
ncbi:alpha/beta fold hydrolase [Nonomuraea sp. NPDC049152]|uniref:alpha/beta fold hydrolase n=1 Tax=Nonomuraea sp. NPDC049152 TaxID=3154350 RepID=UPI00340F9855